MESPLNVLYICINPDPLSSTLTRPIWPPVDSSLPPTPAHLLCNYQKAVVNRRVSDWRKTRPERLEGLLTSKSRIRASIQIVTHIRQNTVVLNTTVVGIFWKRLLVLMSQKWDGEKDIFLHLPRMFLSLSDFWPILQGATCKIIYFAPNLSEGAPFIESLRRIPPP